METAELVLEYIKVFLAWPVSVFVITIFFLVRFNNAIQKFLENIVSIKVGSFEASQNKPNGPNKKIDEQVEENLREQGITLSPAQITKIDEEFDNLSKEKESKVREIADKDETIKYLVERSELSEFAYLSLYLVPNSKLALLWFNGQTKNSSTKENFKSSFDLTGQISNPESEKEAIFNALLVNELIKSDEALFRVTDKGLRFLKYIKLVS